LPAKPPNRREAVQKVKSDGADFEKLYSLLSREAFLAMVDEAAKVGLRFRATCPAACLRLRLPKRGN